MRQARRSSPALATSRVSSKAIRMRSGWLRGSTLLPLQDTDPTPSFGGFGLREDAHDIGATSDLLVETLQGVVGPDLLPVGDREASEGQDVGSGLVQ